MKKHPQNWIEYFSKIAELFSVLPKSARPAQTERNSHNFYNVSYTCYKSLLSAVAVIVANLSY